MNQIEIHPSWDIFILRECASAYLVLIKHYHNASECLICTMSPFYVFMHTAYWDISDKCLYKSLSELFIFHNEEGLLLASPHYGVTMNDYTH